MVLKRQFISDTGEDCSAHSLFRSHGDRTLIRVMCWTCKGRFWIISTLERCGGLKRTDVFTISTLEGVVLKGAIFNNIHIGGCGGFVRTDLDNFHFERVWWWSWKTWLFLQFPLWECMVVLKGLIFFNNFYFGRVWCHERTDFGQFTLLEGGSPLRTKCTG